MNKASLYPSPAFDAPTPITTTYIPPNSPITLRITQRTNLCNTRKKLPSSSLPPNVIIGSFRFDYEYDYEYEIRQAKRMLYANGIQY